jgi:DNA-binding NarL/FixJ family response regulator
MRPGSSERKRLIAVAVDLTDGVIARKLSDAILQQPDLALAAMPGGADILVTDPASLALSGFRAAAVAVMGDSGTGIAGTAVRALLPADATPDTVIHAIRLIAQGLVVVPESVLDRLTYPSPAEASEEEAAPVALPIPLTAREQEVLELLANGASNKIIARRLGVSVHTAKFHVASLLRKLGASGRLEAVGIGLRNGLLMV